MCSRAFTTFIAAHTTLTAIQIQFLRTLETYILQTGKVEKKALVEDPFTRVHPKGIRGVFTSTEIDEVLQFAQRLVA
jgi:type I restriction enzyme R subunit